MIVILWLAASMFLEVSNASVLMVTEILGRTINIDKAVSANNAFRNTVTTEENVNIKMDKRSACTF